MEAETEAEAGEPPETAITAPIRHHSAVTLFFFSLRATLAPPSQRDLFSFLSSSPKPSLVFALNQNPPPSSTSAESRGAAARSSHRTTTSSGGPVLVSNQNPPPWNTSANPKEQRRDPATERRRLVPLVWLYFLFLSLVVTYNISLWFSKFSAPPIPCQRPKIEETSKTKQRHENRIRQFIHPQVLPHLPTTTTVAGLKIRPGYTSYDAYIQHQLNKTLNPKLRKVWTTRDWNRKIPVFARFFQELKDKHLLHNASKALCIGARVGQEVEALRRVGVTDSIGIDLVPFPPLVVKGDFHNQPFDNDTFDFEFSNVFDHALYPHKFVAEIERTLKPNGICVLHVALSRRADKYSANDLFSVQPLLELFKNSRVLQVRNVDGFGLDTEVVFRKKIKQ
ncbi:uncharacterized protein LOC107633898 [Arachis ipaensis]|uniref:uncharacterized protein LOC107633898 n=1 Tax=Arachis ipaensis TaxID=130454 RepID=UPI000A2B8F89|nr:uncharacterized protein LOC107633898 [Arachis ipaensis]